MSQLGTESGYYKEIISKLNNLTRKEYAYYASLGVQFAVIASISAFFVFSVSELVFHFSVPVRTVLFFLFLVISAGTFFYYLLRPAAGYFNLFTKTDYYNTARKVGNNFPSIKDDLLNAMQLVSVNNIPGGYSSGLIDAAFRQVYDKTLSVKFEKIVDFKKSKTLLLYTAGIVLFTSVLFASIPDLRAASARLIDFSTDYIPPAKYIFIIHPGNTSITKGEDVNISVKVMSNNAIPGLNKIVIPGDVKIAVKSEEQTEFEFKSLTADSSGIFWFSSSAVRNSFKYFVKAEDVVSEEYTVNVIDRPIVKTLDLTVSPPAYSKIERVQQRDNGNVTALMGSSILIKLASNKELGKAYVEFDDSTTAELKVNSFYAEGAFRIKGDNNYRIKLNDKFGNENLSPVTYSIKALYDSSPSIEIINPGKDTELANDNRQASEWH